MFLYGRTCSNKINGTTHECRSWNVLVSGLLFTKRGMQIVIIRCQAILRWVQKMPKSLGSLHSTGHERLRIPKLPRTTFAAQDYLAEYEIDPLQLASYL